MDYLVFQLRAPLSAWGETAVGEYRPTSNYPSNSALLGLLAAALGIDREDEHAHLTLHKGYGFAVCVLSAGRLLRDYHTTQVPGVVPLKNRPHFTRRDELNLPKEDLNPILSTRDYRQDAACLVAVQATAGAPYTLSDLAEALQKPRFVLYLGRKSCPLAVPLCPQILKTENALKAIENYQKNLAKLDVYTVQDSLERVVWGMGVDVGCEHDLQVIRKDDLLSRKRWQFGDRIEYIALLGDKKNVL
ncbi:MAG: CRISPR-associated Cas5e family protein [uncultured bacterium]|nr:MAG: CRISPR-associated Cas5e family protein [uncultured bacterium]